MAMKREDMMLIEHAQDRMWTLSADRRRVRMALPPMSVAGLPKPINVNIDFDAGVIEQIIDRLTVLRLQMLPKPLAAKKPN